MDNYIHEQLEVDQYKMDTDLDLIPICSITCQDHHSITPQQHNRDQLQNTNNTQNPNHQSTKESASVDQHNQNPNFDTKKRKVMHREIERQRRQDMATLYSSLRSLLPLEFIKGRRSMSDQIHETVNYIKHFESNIRKLSEKRDSLKKLSNSSPGKCDEDQESKCKRSTVSFTVKGCSVGVEIVIDTSNFNGIPLSVVLEAIIGEEDGLSVVSCVSTKVNQRMLHIIKCEVKDGTIIETYKLEEKLAKCLDKMGYSSGINSLKQE